MENYTRKQLEEIINWLGGKYEREMILGVREELKPQLKQRIRDVNYQTSQRSPKDFGFDFGWGDILQQPENVQEELFNEIDKHVEEEVKGYPLTPGSVISDIRMAKALLGLSGVEPPYPVIIGGVDSVAYDIAIRLLRGYKELCFSLYDFKGIEAVDNLIERYAYIRSDLESALLNVVDERT